MEIRQRHDSVSDVLDRPPPGGAIALAWLGQAGFALRTADALLLVDPYLSDSLAVKYRGREFPHLRMMPPPVAPDALTAVDWVLCTHGHSDHMDPGTLPAIAVSSPACRFLVPRAEIARAEQLGLPKARTFGIDAGEQRPLARRIEALAVAAAHETIETDDRGQCRYLGFVLRAGPLAIYHSGDTVAYDGLAEHLGAAGVDLALLPVNGRDEFRRSRGVLGNMTFDEGAGLCRAAGIPWMLAHHFGMFDFNTVAPDELHRKAAALPAPPHCIVPDVNTVYELSGGKQGRC
jgi:L-ascorbate metabolism protein UlaG (beta-lactamase superfamily)